MSKCYCFDLFIGSYRTRYEIECARFSQAIESVSRFSFFGLRVCSRYIVQTVNKNGEPVSARYNTIRCDVPFQIVPVSRDMYESTIFIPFSEFILKFDDEKETRPENLSIGGSWYVNDR